MRRAKKLHVLFLPLLLFVIYFSAVFLLHHEIRARYMLNFLDIAALTMLSFLATLIKGLRWDFLLRESGVQLKFLTTYFNYLAGLIGVVTPGKVGDVIRTGILKRRYGTKHRNVLPAILMERVTDILSLCLLSSFGVLGVENGWIYIFSGMTIFAALFILLRSNIVIHLFPQKIISRWSREVALRDVLENTKRLMNPRTVLIATAIDCVGWIAESLLLAYLILNVYGYAIAPSSIIFICAFSALVGALSFLPAGLGVMDVSMTLMLTWYGVPLASAASITLIFRIFTIWLYTAVGALFSLAGMRR